MAEGRMDLLGNHLQIVNGDWLSRRACSKLFFMFVTFC